MYSVLTVEIELIREETGTNKNETGILIILK
jgi:hypothetical protein